MHQGEKLASVKETERKWWWYYWIPTDVTRQKIFLKTHIFTSLTCNWLLLRYNDLFTLQNKSSRWYTTPINKSRDVPRRSHFRWWFVWLSVSLCGWNIQGYDLINVKYLFSVFTFLRMFTVNGFTDGKTSHEHVPCCLCRSVAEAKRRCHMMFQLPGSLFCFR